MKAKIFATIFFFLLSFLALGLYISAQDITSIMSQNKIRTCLVAKANNIEKTRNRDCPRNTKDDCEPGEEWNLGAAASMSLSGACDAPNGCEIWYQGGGRAVSGIKPVLRKVVNHVAAGPVKVTVKGPFRDHVGHSFFALGDAPVVVTETGEGGIEGENQTQQVGQVSFPTPTLTVEGSQQKCGSIYWDPFGRVFDAVSLEPMSAVNISLFQSPSRNLVLVPNNPVLTDEAGVYNILIDTEDDYFLTAAPPTTHLFTENFDLNPNYSRVYANIYKPGEIFHEAELPSVLPEDFDFSSYHHDIPLQPKGEPYRGAVAEVIEETLNQMDLNDFVTYSGRVTYPLAQVCLVGETSGVIACGNADQYGTFNMSVSKLSLPQEFIEVKVEKVDLTSL
jgi:hypothetical protein